MKIAVLILPIFLSALVGLALPVDDFWQALHDMAQNEDITVMSALSRSGSGMLPPEHHAAQPPHLDVHNHVYSPNYDQFGMPPSHPVALPGHNSINYQTFTSTEHNGASSSSNPYQPTVPATAIYAQDDEGLPLVSVDHLGQIIAPQSLNPQQRQQILNEAEEVLMDENKRSSKRLKISSFPFAGERLTPGLRYEALGSMRYLVKLKPGLYAVAGKQDSHFPPLTRDEGGMNVNLPNKSLLYVWRRFQVSGKWGSVLQFVGVLQCNTITSFKVIKGFPAYSTGHSLSSLGTDSIYDSTKLLLRRN